MRGTGGQGSSNTGNWVFFYLAIVAEHSVPSLRSQPIAMT